MLEASNLECVRGERSLFAGVSFRLEEGEMLHIQGKNGSGKTSLLRMICGLSPPASGELRWHGTPLHQLGEAYRAQLCYLGHHNAIKDELTPIENLLSSARLAREALDDDAALDALELVGLGGREDLPCRYLSQGQKRRAALARLVHERRALWILDEPYVALDRAAVGLVAGLVGAHLQRGGLAVLTTHQAVAVPAGTVHELWLGSHDAPESGQQAT
ncbi:cytochrome c biogenesis heme-transporting ATPase CcmA [Accumulibacter sp.]|uniref:cytochrome c biogenesis heme-transporting ATPase CcmA n=1 Tax=Accumulibacter sp. TaxID=2053492 RepID=UPI0025DFA09F|nr:cytochrome c biogenesis heme-transporting ATPase CcmA [Accumulibacter sp.]MCM8595219.1 cytochrome c biogenesis heme-transporting ATPase CcmA [Accumulibacter sp.]MCM8626852.1 cytochrome c biogenesis heme-transporting ATPase CcmA [Accumulibacter sp.]MDS4049365.1 cytochrome c biogenesis heme-transporting ATPase CcmA [Accumulibacter sp.]